MTGHLPRVRTLFRWRNLRWALVAALVPVGIWACNPHPLQAPDPFPETQTDIYYEVNPIRKLDLLFVIDNSNSMKEEQENLARNFPSFMQELRNIPGGLPDVRIAVITTDAGAGNSPVGTCSPLGEKGRYLIKSSTGADCGIRAGTAPYIIHDINKQTNFTGMLENVFSCMASQGTNGCGFEHQLQAMRFALAPNVNPDAANFVRDDAYLGIVILSDEDDCSADPEADLFVDDRTFPSTGAAAQAASLRCGLLGVECGGDNPAAMDGYSKPLSSCVPAKRGTSADDKRKRLINVDDFINFVKNEVKKGRADRVIVSGIIGWDESPTAAYKIGKVMTEEGNVLDLLPACSTPQAGKASPGVRLKSFVDAFCTSGKCWHSICQTELKQAMEAIGKQVAQKLSNTCLNDPLIDADPMVQGLQPDCRVSDLRPNSNGPGFTETVLPQCGKGGQPCWKLVNDNMCGAGFKVEVERAMMAPPGTQQSIKCLTCTSGFKNDSRCVRAM